MDSPPENVSVFREYDAVVAESLLVFDGSVWWCDITRGLIRRSRPGDPIDGSQDDVLQLPIPVCSFHPAESGFVVSLADSVVLVDRDGSAVQTLVEVQHPHPRMRLNEGKVDLAGRWVTGSMELESGPSDGAYYSVDTTRTDRSVRILTGGLGVSNGLEWSFAGDRVYFTDTTAQTIYTGAYSAAGAISDVEVFRTGAPHDGLTIDADGNFWSAVFGDGRLMHLDSSGRELFSMRLPAPHLTSLAFDGSTLYVGSAREKLSEQQLAEFPLSGSIFAVETATTGRPPRVFPG